MKYVVLILIILTIGFGTSKLIEFGQGMDYSTGYAPFNLFGSPIKPMPEIIKFPVFTVITVQTRVGMPPFPP